MRTVTPVVSVVRNARTCACDEWETSGACMKGPFGYLRLSACLLIFLSVFIEQTPESHLRIHFQRTTHPSR
jgi:hypothetical protein